ncbi:unnamed protein product [Ectocarpus sp. 8 AP-2014]
MMGDGSDFNQPIDTTAWPSSLERITFGPCFNQPLDGVSWPASLRQLAFSRDFCPPGEGFEWPASLERVTLACPPERALPSWHGVQVFGVWSAWWSCQVIAGRSW